MSFFLTGLGTALPDHAIEQSDAAALVEPLCCDTQEQQRLLSALYRRSGVGNRYSVLLKTSEHGSTERQTFFPTRTSEDDRGPTTSDRMACYAKEAPPLARRAVVAALEDANLTADQVTHLVTVSCTGFAAPGWDLALIQSLPLRPSIARTHVGFMGCHGALNGLRVAKAFTDAEPTAVVLIVALELCSLHHQYGWEPERIVSNALFADGAAAIVGTGLSRRPAGTSVDWKLHASGSHVVPQTADAMTWCIGDHGFVMSLSPRVPDLIQQTLFAWTEAWLAEHELTIDAIKSWAIHPGGPRILSATGDALRLSSEALEPSRKVLRDFGNMSSPTLLYLVDRFRTQNDRLPCVALGFGPGLTIEAAVFL